MQIQPNQYTGGSSRSSLPVAQVSVVTLKKTFKCTGQSFPNVLATKARPKATQPAQLSCHRPCLPAARRSTHSVLCTPNRMRPPASKSTETTAQWLSSTWTSTCPHRNSTSRPHLSMSWLPKSKTHHRRNRRHSFSRSTAMSSSCLE